MNVKDWNVIGDVFLLTRVEYFAVPIDRVLSNSTDEGSSTSPLTCSSLKVETVCIRPVPAKLQETE